MDWFLANQWTGFYMITASVMKELMRSNGNLEATVFCKETNNLQRK